MLSHFPIHRREKRVNVNMNFLDVNMKFYDPLHSVRFCL